MLQHHRHRSSWCGVLSTHDYSQLFLLDKDFLPTGYVRVAAARRPILFVSILFHTIICPVYMYIYQDIVRCQAGWISVYHLWAPK
jgi:hypothetical protein